jgi:hypothetical protein
MFPWFNINDLGDPRKLKAVPKTLGSSPLRGWQKGRFSFGVEHFSFFKRKGPSCPGALNKRI